MISMKPKERQIFQFKKNNIFIYYKIMLGRLEKIISSIAGITIKFLIAGFLFAGTNDILNISLGNNFVGHIWYLVSFAFVVGTFILSIRQDYFGKEQRGNLPRTAFIIILSSLILVCAHGFSLQGTGGNFSLNFDFNFLTFLLCFGLLLFYIGIADFVVELGKSIFSKKLK